ncbi:MAG: hypothetical protein ACRD8O_10190 [Bryobacteraceae bacterium]
MHAPGTGPHLRHTEGRVLGRLVMAPMLLSMGCIVLHADEPHTIKSNLRYRLTWGDMGDPGEVVAAPSGLSRTLRIADGCEQLLQTCRDNPDRWKEDPLVFRFGHLHPGTSIGCRERASPSMHAIFYELPGGSREARVHFDLHGPHNTIGHLSEILRNRLTFGRTSEHEVYRGLVRRNPDGGGLVPEPRYDVAVHARKYLFGTFGSTAIGVAVASAAASSTLRRATGVGVGSGRLVDHLSTNLVRNTVARSIQFSTAAFLQQDQSFSRSNERGFGRRARSALYRSLFVPGRGGNELAFPRIAAALGTPWTMRQWHPGRETAPDPWVQSALLFGRYVTRSFLAEFKPEMTRGLRKVFRRPASNSGGSAPGTESGSRTEPLPAPEVSLRP